MLLARASPLIFARLADALIPILESRVRVVSSDKFDVEQGDIRRTMEIHIARSAGVEPYVADSFC